MTFPRGQRGHLDFLVAEAALVVTGVRAAVDQQGFDGSTVLRRLERVSSPQLLLLRRAAAVLCGVVGMRMFTAEAGNCRLCAAEAATSTGNTAVHATRKIDDVLSFVQFR